MHSVHGLECLISPQIVFWNEWRKWESTGSEVARYSIAITQPGWLGSRVVSVLDSRPGFKSHVMTLSCNSLRQTVHTHCASVQQAAKLVAALLSVAGVTAGLAESNGSLPPGL